MPKKRHLVTKHLEDISGDVLREYSQIIKEMIKSKAGVYVLYRKQKLYYIGLARNLMGRLKRHLQDRHRGVWDRFSVYLTVHVEHMKELETLLLRISNPSGNKTTGKFAKSENLSPTLYNRMKDRDANRRASLIGGRAVQRRIKNKTKKGPGTKGLAGVVDHRIALKATYKGKDYRATLRKNGMIGYENKLYSSPSTPAQVITGRACNGWTFWRFRNQKGKWVPLTKLRK
ncbi:MAG: DUF4357 domain-containing protein [Desulfobacteraceae bacterium]|nr:MAG: DUF4357 domain-containing protein [Desulfobacteraceae bacterium]